MRIQLVKSGESREAFWLDSRTVGHVVENEGKLDLYVLDIRLSTNSDMSGGVLSAPEPPTLVGSFPTSSAANFRYSSAAGRLVFSDYVYSDGNLSTVKEQDEAWENRGNSALVYDKTYERHWDTWTGPKSSSLFSVSLMPTADHKWKSGSEFTNHLSGTGHVSENGALLSVIGLSSTILCDRALPSSHLVAPTILILQATTSFIRRRIHPFQKRGTRNKTYVAVQMSLPNSQLRHWLGLHCGRDWILENERVDFRKARGYSQPDSEL